MIADFHAKAIKSIKNATLIGVCGSDSENNSRYNVWCLGPGQLKRRGIPANPQ